MHEAQKNPLVTGIILLEALLILGLLFLNLHHVYGLKVVQEMAIKRNVASYNTQTGDFEWSYIDITK